MIRPSVRARFAALRRFLDQCFVAVYSFRKNRQEHSPLAALLADDFYLLEREYLSVREALRQNGKNRRISAASFSQARSLAAACFLSGGDSENSIRRFLMQAAESDPITGETLDLFALFLKTEAFARLRQLCRQPGPESADWRTSGLEAIGFLRKIGRMDWEELAAKICEEEKILDQDSIYHQMDRKSRRELRNRIAEWAHKTRQSIPQAVRFLVEKARKEGEYLGFFLPKEKQTAKKWIYFLALFLSTASLSVQLFFISGSILLSILALLPSYMASKVFIHFLLAPIFRDDYRPRLRHDLPAVRKTPVCVTVPTILFEKELREFPSLLERLYLQNREQSACFGMLFDLPEAKKAQEEEDRALFAKIEQAVEKLNERYGSRFYAVIRQRTFSKTQNAYLGRDRKRGAIEDLVDWMGGEEKDSLRLFGFLNRESRYLLTLDYDTEPQIGALERLVAVALHPENAPRFDEQGRMIGGYGVFSPAMTHLPTKGFDTPFGRLLLSLDVTRRYPSTHHELYQDLFQSGSFCGKGLMDLEVYRKRLSGKMPPEEVLSHDLLEGAVLKACYVSDLSFSESQPDTVLSYLNREHRWIRGDWQLFRAASLFPIAGIDRYKIADNLLRSLCPVVSFLMILIGAFLPSPIFLAVVLAALLPEIASPYVRLISQALTGSSLSHRVVYYSRVLPEFEAGILQSLYRIAALPVLAYRSADAIARALWRQLVSRKKLLEWTVFNPHAGKGEGMNYYREFWGPTLLTALVSVALAAAGKWTCLLFWLWCLTPVLFTVLSMPYRKKEVLQSVHFREKVLSWSERMWRYVDDHLTEEDHFLLPDNEQVSPDRGTAHRTSPTNLGLSLLAVLSARDLGFIGTDRMVERLESVLDSLEKLESFDGHLLNWYDTTTMQPLLPRYLSTVDSGNFLVCLCVLQEGLKDYLDEDSRILSLIERANALENRPDFSRLYDRKAGQFFIGYSVERGRLDDNHYDMLMSESRLTGFTLCAKGLVPDSHWSHLEAPYTMQGSHFGIRSWTGTMFEFFMPRLFLPAPEGTEQYEALSFAFAAQRGRMKRGVFGISESCFYAFDPALAYRYKAMGVQKIGEKPHLDDEMVVSPYSTFLTLSAFPEDSFRNLIALEELGMVGKYGFYEAMDFTESRVGRMPERVETYMAHHIGMSLVGCVNALRDELFVRRFTRRKEISAYLPLLENGLPRSIQVPLRLKTPKRGNALPLSSAEAPASEGIAHPGSYGLSQKDYTAFLTETGAGYSLFRGKAVSLYRNDLLENAKGIFFAFSVGKRRIPLTAAPFYRDRIRYACKRTTDGLCLESTAGNLSSEIRVTVREEGEIREIRLKNTGRQPISGAFLAYFEPCLASRADENAHPAFYGLTMECRQEGEAVLYRRRPRKESEEGICCCAGLTGAPGGKIFTDRSDFWSDQEDFLGAFSREGALKEAPIYPCFCERMEVRIPAGGEKILRFACGVGSDAEEAKNAWLKLQGETLAPLCCDTGECLPPALLTDLLFPCQEGSFPYGGKTSCGEILWSAGVSGDLPYLLVEIESEENAGSVRFYLDLFRRLREMQCECELVFYYYDEGKYDRPVYNLLSAQILGFGCEPYLGVRGGIHLCAAGTEEERKVFLAGAAFFAGREPRRHFVQQALPTIRFSEPLYSENSSGYAVEGGRFQRGGFSLAAPIASRPIWSNVLAAPRFGTIVSERGPGFTFFRNSGLFRLTPWENDPLKGDYGERLLLKLGKDLIDPMKRAAVFFEPGKAEYDSVFSGVEIHVEIFLKKEEKIVEVTLRNQTSGNLTWEAAYGVIPALGMTAHRGFYDLARHRCGYYLQNSYLPEDKDKTAYLSCGEANLFTRDRLGFLSGRFDGQESFADDLFAACGRRFSLRAHGVERVRFRFGCVSRPIFAYERACLDEGRTALPERALKMETPDGALDAFVNTFLYEQVVASRLYARSGYYQSSGAYGFRDQLQDCMSLRLLEPGALRRQIIRSCLHQFEEGDVMHWWHPRQSRAFPDRGVRTRCSDDLLWLPLAAAEYVKMGDRAILLKELPYRTAPELLPEEEERYFSPEYTREKESVYAHCLRAFSRGLRYGAHGLLLMGSCDWNDGFSGIGRKGRGESVWLSMFAVYVVGAFLPVCREMGDETAFQRLSEHRRQLIAAIEKAAWDGEWYRRAFFDDGSVLGGAENPECRIDLLPQAFALLCQSFDVNRVRMANEAAQRQLMQADCKAVSLFTPPFVSPERWPGYINGYVAGVRENGGQYTHALCFWAWARYQAKDAEGGYRLLQWLNPAERGLAYGGEPYVLAGDVYTAKEHRGHAGWTWYTGAAGWMLRVVLEGLFGLSRQQDRLSIHPQLPKEWPGAKIALTVDRTPLEICVKRKGQYALRVDGKAAEWVPLDGNRHGVEVWL